MSRPVSEAAQIAERRELPAAEVGDLFVISGHRVGEPERIGEVLEVMGELPHESYRVHCDDGHESLFRPGSDATIRRATHRSPPKARR